MLVPKPFSVRDEGGSGPGHRACDGACKQAMTPAERHTAHSFVYNFLLPQIFPNSDAAMAWMHGDTWAPGGPIWGFERFERMWWRTEDGDIRLHNTGRFFLEECKAVFQPAHIIELIALHCSTPEGLADKKKGLPSGEGHFGSRTFTRGILIGVWGLCYNVCQPGDLARTLPCSRRRTRIILFFALVTTIQSQWTHFNRFKEQKRRPISSTWTWKIITLSAAFQP